MTPTRLCLCAVVIAWAPSCAAICPDEEPQGRFVLASSSDPAIAGASVEVDADVMTIRYVSEGRSYVATYDLGEPM